MDLKSLLNRTAPLLAAGVLALSLGACGSDDDDAGSTGSTGAYGEGSTAQKPKPAEGTGQRQDKRQNKGQGGQIKPKRKAPNSAGDRNGNAPDDVISKRPGGPDSPASP